MLPPFLPGLPSAAELDLTLVFSPFLIGLMTVLGIIVLGFAAYAWCSHLIHTPLQKAVYPRRFVCPVKHQMVETKFVTWKGQPWDVLDVERCSGWCLGRERDCNKECIKTLGESAPIPPLLLL